MTTLKSSKLIYKIKKSMYLYHLRLPDYYFDICNDDLCNDDLYVYFVLNDAVMDHKGFAKRQSALRFLKSEEDKHILMFQNMLDSEGFKVLDLGVIGVANYLLKMGMLQEVEQISGVFRGIK